MASDTDSIDMDALRRKALLSVWLSFLPYSAAFTLAFVAVLRSHGFPEASLGRAGKTYLVSAAIALNNLPDFASIAVFLRLVRFFRKKEVAIGPAGVLHRPEVEGAGGTSGTPGTPASIFTGPSAGSSSGDHAGDPDASGASASLSIPPSAGATSSIIPPGTSGTSASTTFIGPSAGAPGSAGSSGAPTNTTHGGGVFPGECAVPPPDLEGRDDGDHGDPRPENVDGSGSSGQPAAVSQSGGGGGGGGGSPNTEHAKILRVLKYQSLTSLLDFAYVLTPMIPSLGWSRIVSYNFSVVATYWIPLLIIRMNFSQMDNMVDTCFRMIC